MTLAQLELLQRLKAISQAAFQLKKKHAEFCREAGLDVKQEIPSGVAFFLAYLFRPFQLNKLLFTQTGLPLTVKLSDYLHTKDNLWSLVTSVNWKECEKHGRQVVGVSFALVLLSLGAAFLGTRPTFVFCGFMLLGLILFFFAIPLRRLRRSLNYFALSIFAGLITIGYTLTGFSGPSPKVFFGGLIVVALFARLPASRIIAAFSTVAAAILTLSMSDKGIWAPLLLLGLLIGSLWHSSDIMTTDREPSNWRYIVMPCVFIVLFYLLLTGLQQLQFPGRGLGHSDVTRKGAGFVITGFALGYTRLLESLVIGVYQLILYVLERVFRVTTIQFSPIKYTDSHFANIFLVPHLVYAYKREPPLAKKILNYCLISHWSQFTRWWVLQRLRPDAFLSINSKNRSEARQLADLLTKEGLSIWYYEGQLVLGETDWARDIKTAIKYAQSSVVLIGKEGLGDYQKKEIEACFEEYASRQLRVIPIFLPESQPQVVFNDFTFLDFRLNGDGDLFTPDVIQRLKLAITGKNF
jgi:hypothetical protein